MIDTSVIERPKTLREVAEWSDSLEDFGHHLRDWQHEIQRGDVYSRPELEQRLQDPPPYLDGRFPEGDIADAYLAAYAEWIADRAGIARPAWCNDRRRIARKPWFATPLKKQLIASTPASFRQRNIFTTPEPVFSPRPGRPRVPEEQKREGSRRRQQAYRQRIQSIVKQARRKGITAKDA